MNETEHDSAPPEPPAPSPLREALWQLILMRETGPKSAAWHRARMRVIWRIHDRLEREERRAENMSAERRAESAERRAEN